MVLSRRRAAAVVAAIAACFCGASARPKHAEAMYGEASDESGGGGATGGERAEGGEGGEGGCSGAGGRSSEARGDGERRGERPLGECAPRGGEGGEGGGAAEAAVAARCILSFSCEALRLLSTGPTLAASSASLTASASRRNLVAPACSAAC